MALDGLLGLNSVGVPLQRVPPRTGVLDDRLWVVVADDAADLPLEVRRHRPRLGEVRGGHAARSSGT